MIGGLTTRQAEVLKAIRALTRDGVAPSYQEIAERVGLASRGNVHAILKRLEALGKITMGTGRRCVAVVDEAPGIGWYSDAAILAEVERRGQ